MENNYQTEAPPATSATWLFEPHLQEQEDDSVSISKGSSAPCGDLEIPNWRVTPINDQVFKIGSFQILRARLIYKLTINS